MKMLRKKESSKQNTDSENYELWGYAEAAEFLHLSVVTLRRWVSEGKIPYYKPVRRVFFIPQDIMEWVKESKVEKKTKKTPKKTPPKASQKVS